MSYNGCAFQGTSAEHCHNTAFAASYPGLALFVVFRRANDQVGVLARTKRPLSISELSTCLHLPFP